MIDESEHRQLKAAMGLTPHEFLEVIGRVAWFVYEGTEKETAPMHEKI